MEKQIVSKVQIWSLAGPCCILLSILFVSLRPDANDLYLPYASLIGFPLCWKWKLRGLAVSLGMLGGLVAYHWSSIPPDEMLWECGICATFALGFLITALSSDEALAPIQAYQTQSDAQAAEVVQQRETLKSYTDSTRSYEQVVSLAREELLSISRENESIKRDFIDQRHALERSMEESLDACKQEKALQLKAYRDYEHKHDALLKQSQENLNQAFARIETLGKDVSNYKEMLQISEIEKASLQTEIHQRSQAQTMEQKRYEDLLEQLRSQLIVQKSEEPNAEARRYEGLYKQLREQFEEKSRLLDETRRSLFLAEEQMEQLKRETQEQMIFEHNQLEKKLERHILRMEHEFAKKEQQLLSEIEALQDVVTNLTSNCGKDT